MHERDDVDDTVKADDVIQPPDPDSDFVPRSRRYKYLGQVYKSKKDDNGKEIGTYLLYPDGKKLRPWLWTDKEIEKFIDDHPDHLVVSQFEKV